MCKILDKKKVVVGVSGGIDSTASILLLKEQGFDVLGVFLSMLSESVDDKTRDELEYLSKRTGVEIIVETVHERFKKLITDPFTQAYMRGETPSPCTMCNPLIKWHCLLSVADRTGAYYVATGHYCQSVKHNNNYYLSKGKDPLKDQSYYMWRLGQEVLSRMIFPLGEYTKETVRSLMRSWGYELLAEKKESMGVCFLAGRSYKEWLRREITDIDRLQGGELVNAQGEVISTHDGYPFYTLAQKKGLPLKDNQCIVDIDISNNRLIAGSRNELFCSELWLRDWSAVDINELLTSQQLEVKVRGVGINPYGYCGVTMVGDRLHVVLYDDTAWAVTQGQPAVFYISNRVVGGGIAEKIINFND